MNIYLQITPAEDPQLARPADGTADLGRWETTSFALGPYRVALHRQLGLGPSSMTGWSRWSRGRFIWAGGLRNRAQLAAKLQCSADAGVAEVLARALDAWGFGAVEHVDGHLVLCVVDQQARQIRWFRDPFGVVPTVYSAGDGEHAWVGTCLCCFEDEEVTPASCFDEGRMAAYLLPQQDASDREFFCDVRRLKPGCALALRLDTRIRRTVERYWQPTVAPAMDERVFFKRVRAKLREITAQTLTAADDACVSLSGGLDSTFLMATWLDLWRRKRVASCPRAATMSFVNHPATDESQRVRSLADKQQFELSVHDMEDVPPFSRSEFYSDLWGYGPVFHPGESYETEFLARVRASTGATDVLHGVAAEHLFPISTVQHLRYVRERCLQHGDVTAFRLLPELVRRRHRERSMFRSALRHSLTRAAPGGVAWTRWVRMRLGQQGDGFRAGGWWTWRARSQAARSLEAPDHFFESWDWELSCRMGWREQLRTGVVLQYPYQSTALYDLAARLPLAALADEQHRGYRSHMRRLIAGAVPERVRGAEKHGTFSHFLWKSFSEQHKVVEKLLQLEALDAVQLVDGREVRRAWQHFRTVVNAQEGAGFSKPIGSLTFWGPLSLEMWLQS